MRRREFNYVSENRIATAKDKARVYAHRGANARDFHRGIVLGMAEKGYLSKPDEMLLLANLKGNPDSEIDPVYAVVNHGRWIAPCECAGAEVVDPEDPFFLCLTCFNEKHDGRLRMAVFPAGHKQIEHALLERSDPRTRGWDQGETVGDLRRQTEQEEGKR
jgi:hypothetical protein